EWLDPRIRGPQHRAGGRLVAIGAPVLILGAGLLAPFVVDATSFPDAISVSVQDPVNAFVGWVTDTFSGITIAIKDVITNFVLNTLESLLTDAPWWLVVAVVALIAWSVSGRRPAIVASVCLGLIVVLGLWNHSMVTLANVIVGTLLPLLIGIPIGGRWGR